MNKLSYIFLCEITEALLYNRISKYPEKTVCSHFLFVECLLYK